MPDVVLIRVTKCPFEKGQVVRDLDGNRYEFGYVSGMGYAIVYLPGECNMQDSVAFCFDELILVNKGE